MVVHIASVGLQLATSVDLRRKRSRDMAEIVADHAQWALPDDRAVIWAIYRDGLTAQQVAHLRSESPRLLRARVRRIVARLVSEQFRFVLRKRDGWPQLRRAVGGACVLQGRSMRDAASFLRLSLHQVRREMGVIRALMDEESRPVDVATRAATRAPARAASFSGARMTAPSQAYRAPDRASAPTGMIA